MNLFYLFSFNLFCCFQQTGHCNLLVDRPFVAVRRRDSGEVANGLGGGGNGMTTGGAPGTLMKPPRWANWPRWTSWAIECGSWWRDGSPPDWCRCPSMEQLSIALTTCWNRCTTYTNGKNNFTVYFLLWLTQKAQSFGCPGVVGHRKNSRSKRWIFLFAIYRKGGWDFFRSTAVSIAVLGRRISCTQGVAHQVSYCSEWNRSFYFPLISTEPGPNLTRNFRRKLPKLSATHSSVDLCR